MQKIIALSEAEHQKFLENKKQEIVSFHLKNNDFYKDLVGKNWSGNWNDLPVLNKKNLQKPLSERLSEGFTEKSERYDLEW